MSTGTRKGMVGGGLRTRISLAHREPGRGPAARTLIPFKINGDVSKVVAEYAYCDLFGEAIASKVRLDPKGFRWRTPDPRAALGYRCGLRGRSPGLYRWP